VAAPKANRKVSRVVYAAFVTVTAVFVSGLIYEVATQVFAGEAPKVDALAADCAQGVKALEGAVNRGIAAGLGTDGDADDAVARYRGTRDEEWKRRDAVAAACAAQPRGTEAMAALARLDRQAEGVVRRQTAELRVVRREVDSFIRSSPNERSE
jgi:hypothetical protein